MGLFRRKPIHQRLAEEGGLVERQPGPLFTGMIPETGIHGVPREREWDSVVTVDTPEAQGSTARFVGLADGTLLVEDGEGDLTELANAIEQEVAAPYRAIATRRGGDRWAVAARMLRVVELQDLTGDEIELVVKGGERRLVVDGASMFGTIPQLEQLGDGDCVIRAARLDGALWEVHVHRL